MHEITAEREQGRLKGLHREPTLRHHIRLTIFVEAGHQHDLTERRRRTPRSFIGRRTHLFFHVAKGLSRALPETLGETPGPTIYSLSDPNRLAEQVLIVAFRLRGWHPRQVAEALDKEYIYVWEGNYYALAVTERLGLEANSGMVRVGLVHYNMVEEIERFGEGLRSIFRNKDIPLG